METFITKKSEASKLFVEVRVFHKDLARTWIIKQEANSTDPKKEIIADSKPGSGNIDFFIAGETKAFKDQNNIVIVTYLDTHKVKDIKKYISELKIEYQIVEDDNIPGEFFENKTYTCKKEEIEISDNNEIALVIKVIKIK